MGNEIRRHRAYVKIMSSLGYWIGFLTNLGVPCSPGNHNCRDAYITLVVVPLLSRIEDNKIIEVQSKPISDKLKTGCGCRLPDLNGTLWDATW